MAIVVAVFDLVRVLWETFPEEDSPKCPSPPEPDAGRSPGTGSYCRNQRLWDGERSHHRTTPYQVSIPKDGGKLSSLKIVLAADLHLGYSVGKTQMRQMVEKINRESPDLVVIAEMSSITTTRPWMIPGPDLHPAGNPKQVRRLCLLRQSRRIGKKFWRALPLTVRVRKESDPRMDSFLERRASAR